MKIFVATLDSNGQDMEELLEEIAPGSVTNTLAKADIILFWNRHDKQSSGNKFDGKVPIIYRDSGSAGCEIRIPGDPFYIHGSDRLQTLLGMTRSEFDRGMAEIVLTA